MGAGWVSTQHAKAYLNNPHTRVAAICSLKEESAQKLAKMYEQAPALVRKKIGNVPVISLISAFAFVTIMSELFLGQIIPTFQGTLDPGPVIWTFGIFFAGIPFYYIVRAYRLRHDGFDLSLVYKQIPPD